MKKTYIIKKDKNSAWDWDRYEKAIQKEWQQLLDNQNSRSEKDFQSFLERNPCCLPSPHGVFQVGAHGLFPTAVISQPKLTGLQTKIPDFLLISRDSASIYANFIEIEAPNKTWATKKGQQSAELTQAINQIKDWKSWFENGINRQKFIQEYKLSDDMIEGKSFQQKYILIYGRRNDPNLTPDFNKKRTSLQNTDEIFMTYDRLVPNSDFKDYMTVKLDSNGYHAVQIPPTLRISPFCAQDWCLIKGKETAVNNNIFLSKGRKKFLNSRWTYWDRWAKAKNYGIIDSADYE